MRGIVLAGGTGSRLGPLTKAVNKHLLPVGGVPMITWPINTLLENGITDITIVSSAHGIGQLAMLLGGGYTYRVQEKPGGITQAIACANNDQKDAVAVILGDNVFLPSPRIPRYHPTVKRASCYLRSVSPNRVKEFGVPTFGPDGNISRIDEKPTTPANNKAVTGLYVFSHDVFDEIRSIGRSVRGEFEITDLLNLYADIGVLDHTETNGFWGDAGTIDGMMECSIACDDWNKTNREKLGCN